MKPAPFRCFAPISIAEALDLIRAQVPTPVRRRDIAALLDDTIDDTGKPKGRG